MSQSNEPIAIIGMGCRLPGSADSPEMLWKNLVGGKNAIRVVPRERFNLKAHYHPRMGARRRSYSKWAGLIDQFDRFDAGFFRISPREAAYVDPQHRYLLESAWRAIEDAGHPLDLVKGEPIGVFVGISTLDYNVIQTQQNVYEPVGIYNTTGAVHSIAANRISYTFNLKGPSFAVDTACSSSLVAIHQACQSLQNRECEIALAGGVNAILGPSVFVCFSRMGMLSPQGRCYAFDSRADGFVRGEGAAMLMLKPLEKALEQGDRIYAVIRGSGLNQDGRTNGITVPSLAAQRDLTQSTCLAAGVDPEQIVYAEAHGTGTPVGDPIEAGALGAILGKNRSGQNPCLIGSIKTNIGHLEAASGAAGMIKAALVLKNRHIPPSLNFKSPNPNIDFTGMHLKVVTENTPLPDSKIPPMVLVNSFGFGGANANAILEAPPQLEGRRAVKSGFTPNSRNAKRQVLLLPLSANSTESFPLLARALREAIENDPERDIASWALTAARQQTHFTNRQILIADDHPALIERLKDIENNRTHPDNVEGAVSVTDSHTRPVWVFSGQGPQWYAMGRELLKAEPVFREVVAQCDRIMSEWSDWSLLEEMQRAEIESRIGNTAVDQPAIFAVQAGLADLLKSWGLFPGAVVGHSVGEAAAAYASGVLNLEEACRVIFFRGAAMDATTRRGRMLAVGLSEEDIVPWLEGVDGTIDLAAINSPGSVTLSGDAAALEALARTLEQRHIYHQFLKVNYAFHSYHMEEALDPFRSKVGPIALGDEVVPLYSTVSGKRMKKGDFDLDYWCANIRSPVRFAGAIRALVDEGNRHFFEIGPHPVLVSSIQECLRDREQSGVALGSLRRGEPEVRQLLRASAEWFTQGFEIDWETLLGTTADDAPLPPYPWKKSHHWHEPDEHYRTRVTEPEHNWLHSRLAAQHPVWHTILDRDTTEAIRDHIIQRNTVFPASAYIETALEAAKLLYPGQQVLIEDIALTKALFLPEKASVRYQFSYQPDTFEFRIHSLDMKTPGEWSLHCQGKMRVDTHCPPARSIDLRDWKGRARTHLHGKSVYQSMALYGFHYGPHYRAMKNIHRGEQSSLVEIELAREVVRQLDDSVMHPCLLDHAFQACMVTGPEELMNRIDEGYLPVGCGRIRIFQPPKGKQFFVASELTYAGGNVCRFRMTLMDSTGAVLAEIEDFETRSALKTEHSRAIQQGTWLYRNVWEQPPMEAGSASAEPVFADTLPAPAESEEKRALNRALNRLAAGYLVRALQEMGLKPDTEGLIRTATPHRKFKKDSTTTRRLVQLLDTLSADTRLVSKTWQGWILKSRNQENLEALWSRTLDRHPRAYPELLLLRRCAGHLPAYWSGKLSWSKWLQVPENLTLIEHIDRDSISWQSEKEVLGRECAAWLQTQGGHQPEPLQLLHCQGGAGGLATQVLDQVGDLAMDALFIENQGEMLALAEKHFFDHTRLRTLQLKAGTPLNGRDLRESQFDFLILENPAAGSIGRLLRWSRRLLKPDGTLVLVGPRSLPGWMRLAHEMTSTPAPVAGWEASARQAGFTNYHAPKWPGAGLAAASFRKPPKIKSDTVKLSLSSFSARAPQCAVLFTDRGGVCKQLQAKLEEESEHQFSFQEVDFIQIFPGRDYRKVDDFTYEIRTSSKADMQRVMRDLALCYDMSCSMTLYGWPLDIPELLTAESLEQYTGRTLVPLLHFAQIIASDQEMVPGAFQILTRGAVAAGEKTVSMHPAGSLVSGFFRSWIMEIGSLRARIIDLDPSAAPAADIHLLAQVVQDEAPESEVALRQGRPHYLRIESAPLPRSGVGEKRKKGKKKTAGFRLEVTSPGMMDSLEFLQTDRKAPSTGQVEVEIKAAAFNFRDVLKTLDLYPSDVDLDRLIGDECAGVVTRVGRGVRSFKPGSEVVLTAAGCFASHITVPEEAVISKPDSVSYAEAVTVPVAFLTAHYALRRLGQIRKGETILIQAGTGGVGLASIQVARHAGATVYATAGDPGKREFLNCLGVEGVFDSRSIAFEEQVRDATGGRGVDVVLNSLAGPAIEKGISCLAPFGRFLEIGKRDIYANTPVGLRPFRNNISMHVIDLGVFLQEGGEAYHALMREVQENFQNGIYRPLPYRRFPMARAREACRTMSQARHMGKIVLVNDGAPVQASPRPKTNFDKVSSQGAYIVTGGMRGFGLETVKWLCRHGAGHVYAIGRQVRKDEDVKELLQYASSRGVECHLQAVDITRLTEVSALFDRIRRSGIPLRGIIHSAVVLEDGLVQQQNAEKFHRVLAPKVAGAWNLHEASQDCRLDFFVLYSSVVALLGNVGQTNYAAANTFLDALSHYRQAMGLPSLTVNWGHLGEVGVVARSEKLAASLKKRGFTALQPGSAFKHLERLLANDHVQTGVVPVDWPQFFQTFSSSRERPYFSKVTVSASAASSSAVGSLRDLVLAEPVDQRLNKMVAVLQEEIANVMRSSAARISPTRSLNQLGLDSLMIFELIVRLENAFELSLPTGRLKATSTLDELAHFLLELLNEYDEGSGNGAGKREEQATGTPQETSASLTQRLLPASCQIVMRRGRSRSPVFAIHPTGGRIDAYKLLIKALPSSLPFHAIQSRVWTSENDEFGTIPEMAEAYAGMIRQTAGDHPIRLIGHSNGGYFAWAVAQAIEADGGSVDWLGLIDCLDSSNDPGPDNAREMIRRYCDPIEFILSRFNPHLPSRPDLEKQVAGLVQLLLDLPKGTPYYPVGARWIIEQGWVPDHDYSKRLLQESLKVWEHHANLVKSQRFGPVAADVCHWVSEEVDLDQEPGSERKVAALALNHYREIPVPARHYEMLRGKNAVRIAREISREFNQREHPHQTSAAPPVAS